MKRLFSILLICITYISAQATVYEYNPSDVNGSSTINGSPVRVGQTFTVGSIATNEAFVLDSLVLTFNRTANYVITIEIYTLSGGFPTGSAISSGTIPADGVSTYFRVVEMSPVALLASTSYAIVFYSTTVQSGLLQVHYTTPSSYTGGNYIYYDGATWSTTATYDFGFYLYGKHAPIITTQPVSISRCVGTSATFSVVVDSDSPTYQWRKDGGNISGATSSSYTIASVVTGSAASYDCVVTESLLSTTTTSSAAILTVPTTTSITSHPSGLTRCVGTGATFTVTALGSGLTYQWQKDGVNVSGTGSSYTIPSVTVSDAGNYSVIVTGTCGVVTSNNALLVINTNISITSQPASQSICVGDNALFSVTVTGTGPTYQWRKDNINIGGATSSTYSISGVLGTDEGSYDVVITGTCSNVTSNDAILTVGATTSNSQLSTPALHYSFDNTLIDSALSGNNLVAYGNASFNDALSPIGSHSGDLDGANDYFKINQTFDIGDTTLIVIWFRSDVSISSSRQLFSSSDSTNLADNFRISAEATNTIRIYSGTNSCTPNITIAPSTWNQLVISAFKQTTSTRVRVWYNGAKCTMGSDSAILYTFQRSGRWNIGVDHYINGDWNGNIDEFMIYKGFIPTEAQVDSLYNLDYKSAVSPCEQPIPPTGRKKILLAGKLRNILLAAKQRDFGAVINPSSQDTIQYFLYDDFETWTTASVDNVDSLINRWQINIGAMQYIRQSMVDIAGTHNNVWKSIVNTGERSSLELTLSLADTASEMWFDYDLYADPLFDSEGAGGAFAGKMLQGFFMGNFHDANYVAGTEDTVTTSGLGGWMKGVWGTAENLMGYGYYHAKPGVYDGKAEVNGANGIIYIPKGTWKHISTRLKVNTPGLHNGFYEIYENGVLTIQVTDIKFRSITQGEDFAKIEALNLNFFFGGGTSDYNSKRNNYIYLDNLVAFKYKQGATWYNYGINTDNKASLIITPPSTKLAPADMLINETYTNASDTIYDVGNGKHYIYWPPMSKETITKEIIRPSGTINYAFLTEEFGYSASGDCEFWVKVYSGLGVSKILIDTYGRTDQGYTDPSGNYLVNDNEATFEIHTGCAGGTRRGVAIRYWSEPNILFLGNSTMYPIYDLFIADDEPYISTNIAAAGDNINDQLAKWNALTTQQQQGFDYVLVQVGLNDTYSSGYVTRYQNLINQINADKKTGCKIIAATLTAARPNVNYTAWQEINAAIRGEAPTPITGIDIIMTTNTSDLDVNSDGYLDAAYDSGDHTHPNNAGDLIIKNNYLEVLNAQ